MEYSDLAEAFSKNDVSEINRLLEELHPRLIQFLQVRFNADIRDAEDCVQEAILASLQTIKNGKMRDTEYLLSFLLSTCRNKYLNLENKKKPLLDNDRLDNTTIQPQQLNKLLDKEKQRLLSQCLDKLSQDYRTFIEYWLVHPDSKAKKVANHFKMSIANVWTKKHRILKKLNDCYQNKIKK